MKNIYLGIKDNVYFLNLKGVRDSIRDVVICENSNKIIEVLFGIGGYIQKGRKFNLKYDKDVGKETISFIQRKASEGKIKLEDISLDK